MMDITCDTCGKKYRIDETKMKSDKAKVRCKTCGNIIVVTRPAAPSMEPSLQPPETQQSVPAAAAAQATEPLRRPAPAGAAQPIPKPAAGSSAAGKEAPGFLSEQKIRFGLFTKIIIVMLIVSLLPFTIFWGITLKETNTRIRNDTEALMAQTAAGIATQVDSWIDSNVAVLRMASQLPEIIDMDRQAQEPILKAIQKEYPWMYLVFTVGPDGINVARNDNRPLKDYSDRQYYKDIINGKKLSWQTLVGKTSKKPALVLAVPIKFQNRLVGVIAAAMTIDELSRNIATWRQGKTGYAFLVDEKGYVVSHPNKQYVLKRKNLNSHPLIASFRQKGWTTITGQFNASGGQAAFGHVRSTNYGWALVLQQQESEVFGAYKRVQDFALILLGCTILLVAAIAWFSARAIVTPIMKLTDAAERMSLGDLNVKIDIKSKDEIGLLAQAIGRMQTSLRLAMSRLRKKR